MGFFAALGRLLTGETAPVTDGDRRRLMQSWDLYEEPSIGTALPEGSSLPAGSEPSAGRPPDAAPLASSPHAYDRQQWHRKLRTLLDRLPESEDQWPDVVSDAGALGLDAAWVEDVQQQEFVLLVRRAVADRRVTPGEHRKLELARTLIGLSEEQAETILHDVVAEAEAIFGGEVDQGR